MMHASDAGAEFTKPLVKPAGKFGARARFRTKYYWNSPGFVLSELIYTQASDVSKSAVNDIDRWRCLAEIGGVYRAIATSLTPLTLHWDYTPFRYSIADSWCSFERRNSEGFRALACYVLLPLIHGFGIGLGRKCLTCKVAILFYEWKHILYCMIISTRLHDMHCGRENSCGMHNVCILFCTPFTRITRTHYTCTKRISSAGPKLIDIILL